MDKSIQTDLLKSRSISERLLLWLAHPHRQRKIRNMSRGSFIGCQLGNIFFVAASVIPGGFFAGYIILALIVTFLASFFLIYCAMMLICLPIYLLLPIVLSPAQGALIGLLSGIIYSFIFPAFQLSAFAGVLFLRLTFYGNWVVLEPWQAGIAVGGIYGLLIGTTIGVLEKRAHSLKK